MQEPIIYVEAEVIASSPPPDPPNMPPFPSPLPLYPPPSTPPTSPLLAALQPPFISQPPLDQQPFSRMQRRRVMQQGIHPGPPSVPAPGPPSVPAPSPPSVPARSPPSVPVRPFVPPLYVVVNFTVEMHGSQDYEGSKLYQSIIRYIRNVRKTSTFPHHG